MNVRSDLALEDVIERSLLHDAEAVVMRQIEYLMQLFLGELGDAQHMFIDQRHTAGLQVHGVGSVLVNRLDLNAVTVAISHRVRQDFRAGSERGHRMVYEEEETRCDSWQF